MAHHYLSGTEFERERENFKKEHNKQNNLCLQSKFYTTMVQCSNTMPLTCPYTGIKKYFLKKKFKCTVLLLFIIKMHEKQPNICRG